MSMTGERDRSVAHLVEVPLVAARALRRSPVLAVVVVVTLAVLMGAATGAFVLIDALLLRPLPIRDQSRLMTLASGGSGNSHEFTYRTWDAIRRRATVFGGAL